MLITRFERMATDALAHEQGTGALTQVIRGRLIARFGSDPAKGDLIDRRTGEAVAFIQRYVAATPELLSAVSDAARDADRLADFLPIFDAAEDYFLRAIDFIPDHIGLAGLTDDSYLVQLLLQRLADEHLRLARTRLIPFDLAPANALMRRMIGEPLATTLDASVGEIYGFRDVQLCREHLTRTPVKLRLRMPDPYEGPLCAPEDMDLNLGALGQGRI